MKTKTILAKDLKEQDLVCYNGAVFKVFNVSVHPVAWYVSFHMESREGNKTKGNKTKCYVAADLDSPIELLEEDNMSVTNVEDIQKQIAEAQKTLQELQDKLEKEKNKKWEPEGGDYYVNNAGCVCEGFQYPASASFGVEFKTRQAAEKAAKAYRAYHRLYKLAEELNQGWEPCLDDDSRKWIVFYNYGNWSVLEADYSHRSKIVCGVYFKNKETALKAVEMIRNGALE